MNRNASKSVFLPTRTALMLLSSTCFMFLFLHTAAAEELEMINRPVNVSGLTGLLFTTCPFTVSAETVEAGIAAASEKSSKPHYSSNEIPSITATVGLGQDQDMEIALKGSYFRRTDESGTKRRGKGDTELSWKWNFLPQTESSSIPALALIVTGIAPTSDSEADVPGVVHWGSRLGLTAGREIILGDHVIGIYADGQMVLQDLSDARFRDRYALMNAGILFPISKYRNLQMLVEYTLVTGVDSRIAVEGGDYSGITSGLRLVGERFNLSIGTQFLRKQAEGFDNSTRIIGMMSFKI